MRSKRPFVIVAGKLLDPIETRMMELFTCGLNLDDKIFDKSEPTAAVGQADAPVPTATDRIDAEVRADAPRVEADRPLRDWGWRVDIAVAQQYLIIVANSPAVLEGKHRSHDTGVDPCGFAATGRWRKASPQRRLDRLEAPVVKWADRREPVARAPTPRRVGPYRTACPDRASRASRSARCRKNVEGAAEATYW